MRAVNGEYGDSELIKILDAIDEQVKPSAPFQDTGSLSGTGLFPYPSDAELFSGLALQRKAAGKSWDPERRVAANSGRPKHVQRETGAFVD